MLLAGRLSGTFNTGLLKASLLTRSFLDPICPVTASNKVGTRPRFLKRLPIGVSGADFFGGDGLTGGLSTALLLGTGAGAGPGLGMGPMNGAGAGAERGG